MSGDDTLFFFTLIGWLGKSITPQCFLFMVRARRWSGGHGNGTGIHGRGRNTRCSYCLLLNEWDPLPMFGESNRLYSFFFRFPLGE